MPDEKQRVRCTRCKRVLMGTLVILLGQVLCPWCGHPQPTEADHD